MNRQKHGFSLSEAEQVEILAVLEDERADDGEKRFLAFGRLAGRGVYFVFTTRNGNVRVISLRSSREKEMKRYVPER